VVEDDAEFFKKYISVASSTPSTSTVNSSSIKDDSSSSVAGSNRTS
jgi:hypothetical protein